MVKGDQFDEGIEALRKARYAAEDKAGQRAKTHIAIGPRLAIVGFVALIIAVLFDGWVEAAITLVGVILMLHGWGMWIDARRDLKIYAEQLARRKGSTP